ncbi:MAG: radical SAM protein, partial [Deltaproteobacteria bacterium]|nr:radical SAM protein [Deltaproteobacteria bacterium]
MTDLSVISQDGVAASTGQAEASATRSPLLADPPGQSQSHPESEPFKRGPGPEAGKGVKPAHPEAGPKGPNPSADGSPPSLGPAFNRPDDLFAGLTGQVPRLPQGLHGLQNGLRQAADTSRIRIPLNYLALIEAPGDPIWLQSVPHPAEWEARESGADRGIQPGRDPLAEDRPEHSPVPHLTIRYPDRALLQVTGLCPMYCRFCMRKRKTLQGEAILPRAVDAALEALAHHPAVREVILSGGDPLMVPDNRLLSIARRALAVPHVRSLRIHTRMACMAPERITPE